MFNLDQWDLASRRAAGFALVSLPVLPLVASAQRMESTRRPKRC